MTGSKRTAAAGRRRAAGGVLALLVAMGGGAAAWAQATGPTTTESPSLDATTTTTDTPTTTTSTPTTTTSDPCSDQPCPTQPPAAFVSGSAGEVQAARGSYCWSDPSTGRGVCADILPGPTPSLSAKPGETLSLRFTTDDAPTAVSLTWDRRDPTPLPASNPTQFTVDLPPGSHELWFLTDWAQGDAAYGVTLVVDPAGPPRKGKPAAPVTGRPVALAG